MSRIGSMRSRRASAKSTSRSNSKSVPPFERQWQHQLEDYVTAIAWSPSDDYLAASSAAGEVVLGYPDGSLEVLQSRTDASVNGLAISSDGQFLAAAGQSGQVVVWAIEPSSADQPNPHATSSTIFSSPQVSTWMDCLTWHPTAPILAVGVGPIVQLWSIPDNTLITELDFERSSVLDLAWHPYGRYLAVSGHGGVSVWAATNWLEEPEFMAVPGASIAVQWSANGRYLGSGNLDQTLTVMDWGHPPPWFMQGFPSKVRQLSWSAPLSATGSPLLAAACANGVTVWERETAEGGIWRNRILNHHTQIVEAIAFQPQTFTLASASQDGTIVLWRKAKSVAQVLDGAHQGWGAIAWSPNGQHLAAGGQAGELTLWSQSSRGKGFQV